ncbi:TIGR04222 domain-containing membrane protein [Crossiella sp. CA198]|uniref:TIGR04222 domain-containing membrane protein n=1 Tax=Crossiella sp. CA198 TaxID=3455607 RepID=UPI003F8D1530
MHDTWGLTGPEFIGLYVLALIITVAVAIRRRLAARKLPPGHPTAPALSADEAAYLAGGTRRLVETALARLVAGDALRVSRGNPPAATGKPAESTMDDRVLTAVRDRKTRVGVEDATQQLDRSPELRELRQRLLWAHLLVSPERSRACRMAAATVFLPIALIGALRLSDGASNGKPIAILILLLAVTTALALIITLVPGPRATTLGQRALNSARADAHRRRLAGVTAGGFVAGDVVLLVALSGMSGHPDSAVASGLATDGGGAGGGGSGCSGGGGGCSGGGGGGGGGCGG